MLGAAAGCAFPDYFRSGFASALGGRAPTPLLPTPAAWSDIHVAYIVSAPDQLPTEAQLTSLPAETQTLEARDWVSLELARVETQTATGEADGLSPVMARDRVAFDVLVFDDAALKGADVSELRRQLAQGVTLVALDTTPTQVAGMLAMPGIVAQYPTAVEAHTLLFFKFTGNAPDIARSLSDPDLFGGPAFSYRTGYYVVGSDGLTYALENTRLEPLPSQTAADALMP